MTPTRCQSALLLTIAAQDHLDGAQGADRAGRAVYLRDVAGDLAPQVGGPQAAGGTITAAAAAGLVTVDGDTIADGARGAGAGRRRAHGRGPAAGHLPGLRRGLTRPCPAGRTRWRGNLCRRSCHDARS